MTNEVPDQSGKMALLFNQPQNEVITSQEKQSYIQDCKEELGKRLAIAKTTAEVEEILNLSPILYELETKEEQLKYAQKLAEIRLREAKQKLDSQQSHQVVAIVASIAAVVLGIYFMPITPLPSVLFLVLGLAKPLGYSLGEVGSLLSELKGFPQSSDELLYNENKKEIRSEESENAEV